MTWWRRHRRNLLSFIALFGLVPLAGWATLDGAATFLRERQPVVPIVPASEGTVSYGGADLQLEAFTVVDSLPTFDGPWSPPTGYRLWSATLSASLADPAVPLDNCEVSLSDRAGIVIDGSPLELSQPTGGSSFLSCGPAEVEVDAPSPPRYEFKVPFLTADDFVPAAVRVVVPDELPRYASLPVPAGAGG